MSTVGRRASSYLYLAAKVNGGRSVGVRTAETRRALVDDLRRERLVPLRTWEFPSWLELTPRSKLKPKDQAEIHTQLSQLLSRGVSLVEALDVTGAAVAPVARPLVGKIRTLVAGGSSFAAACQQTGAFDRVTIAVYRAAERSGDLAGAAKQLSITLRRQLAVMGKAATLMLYPIIVLSLSILMGTGIIMFIVPRIGRAIESMGKPLPLPTKILVTLGEGLVANWVWALLGLLVAITLGVMSRKQIAGLIARLSRRIPVLRDVVLAQESTRFFTVMAAMSRSGVPLSDALGVATGVIGHPRLRSQLATLQTKLIEGGLLRVLIERVDALPLPTRRLLVAAERTGDLTPAFETLAADATEDVERLSGRFLAVLEPALIIVMFLVIGTLLLSIMIPLMKAPASVG
ncbi:MAG: type II secretion system F family protein [Phycisphaerales bacterium]|nr:MAG: type II secretion system F family protein [Phycisphaerales bacterium]